MTNTKDIWMGSMTIEQAQSLEPVFAKFTENGWVLPQWLVELKLNIIMNLLKG